MANANDGRRPPQNSSSQGSKSYARGRVVRGANGTGREGYVPGTRAGRGENPRQSHIGSNKGGRDSRPVQKQHKDSLYRSERNYRTLAGHDTGYTLKGRRNGRSNGLSYGSHRHGLLGRYDISNRMLIALAAAAVVVVMLVLGVSSCMGSLGSKKNAASQEQQNQWDARVSAKTSQGLTSKLTPRLDVADKLLDIAKKADTYASERIPELATLDDGAVAFVAALDGAEKNSRTYDDPVEKGSYPLFYTWDTRWGYVDFAGNVLGVTGSGPTALSMAYMGLVGKADQTPATIAHTATEEGLTNTEDPFVNDGFVPTMAEKIGLTSREGTASADGVSSALGNGSVALALLKPDFTTPYAHWAFVTGPNSDRSVNLLDPTSSKASAHAWSAGTIGENISALYTLSYTAPTGDASATTTTSTTAATN